MPIANQYFNITTKNLANSIIKTATIEFEVNESWLNKNGADASDVVMKHFTTAWDPLPTKLIGKLEEEYSYQATTPSFSLFAITLEKPKGVIAPESEIVTPSAKPAETSRSSVGVTGESVTNKQEKESLEEKPVSKPIIISSSLKKYIGGIILIVLVGVIGFYFFFKRHREEWEI